MNNVLDFNRKHAEVQARCIKEQCRYGRSVVEFDARSLEHRILQDDAEVIVIDPNWLNAAYGNLRPDIQGRLVEHVIAHSMECFGAVHDGAVLGELYAILRCAEETGALEDWSLPVAKVAP